MTIGALDGFFGGMRTSSSGLTAERTRMDVIAENIANARTTRTPDGGPYQRKLVDFQTVLRESAHGDQVLGVSAAKIVRDSSTPFKLEHDPGHPDADDQGNVHYPNVNSVLETADLITAMRSYQSNLAAQESFVRMAERALEIAR